MGFWGFWTVKRRFEVKDVSYEEMLRWHQEYLPNVREGKICVIEKLSSWFQSEEGRGAIEALFEASQRVPVTILAEPEDKENLTLRDYIYELLKRYPNANIEIRTLPFRPVFHATIIGDTVRIENYCWKKNSILYNADRASSYVSRAFLNLYFKSHQFLSINIPE